MVANWVSLYLLVSAGKMVARDNANKITDTMQNILKTFVHAWAPDPHMSYSDLT